MKTLLLLALLAVVGFAQEEDPTNVNSKYTVDSVRVDWPKHKAPRLSATLRSEIDTLVGENLDQSHLQDLAKRIKKELRVPDVSIKVNKGAQPERVSVSFEVNHEKQRSLDLDVTQFAFHSTQGWSADGGARINYLGNTFKFDLVSDNDALAERYSGIRAGYERRSIGTDRLGLRFTFSDFHQRWNAATRLAAAPDELYRSRQSFRPEATVVLAEPLTLSAGVDFTRFRPEYSGGSTRTGSSNAVVSTLRYHQRWGSDGDPEEQEVHASFDVRAARPWLESDTSFTRQASEADYRYRRGRSSVVLRFMGGWIDGAAPIFERFVLGNTRTLRGWNKYDFIPFGASHAAHGTIEYSYRGAMLFYDTGAAWDQPAQRTQRHALGFGFKTKDGFQLAVAFPVREGHADPVFYLSF